MSCDEILRSCLSRASTKFISEIPFIIVKESFVKGVVPRYSVIFCAFLREQKMAVARASVADIRSESLAVRAAWQPGQRRPTLAADMTVP